MNSQNLNTKMIPVQSSEVYGLIEISEFTIPQMIPHIFAEKDFFKNLVHDECTETDWINYLMNHPYLFQVSIGGEFAGLFMIDDLGEVCNIKTCEIHAFILPHMRRYSTQLLKSFAWFVFTESEFDAITTTVPDHTKYVIKLLKSIGFVVLGNDKTQFKRNGQDINMSYLVLTIDKFGD